MSNINKNRGFAAVETALILVIVGLIAFTAWYVFHTKSNTDSTLDNAAAYQNVVNSKKANTPTKTNTQTAAQVVTTKTDSKLGQYLADKDGKTLYTYDQDTAKTSNCTGSCLSSWPVYKAASATAPAETNVGVITRSDGTLQYTYKDMPLYYFTGDSAAGKVTGNGVNYFSVAKP